MYSINETMKKIIESPVLREQFLTAIQEGKDETLEFLHSLGCEAEYDELVAAFNKMTADNAGEMSPEELELIAGGSKAGANKFLHCLDSFFSGWADV